VPGFLDRHRATRLMQEQGLDALVLAQPETIQYATGAFPGVATYWRRAGAAFVLVPADETAPLAAIVGDLQAKSFAAQSGIADVGTHRIWVETDTYPVADDGRTPRSPRPAQYDLPASLALLRDLLTERDLLNAKIGLELGFIPAADFQAFGDVPVAWQDCTRIVERLRAIKAPPEIDHLRKAAQFAEAARRGEPLPQSGWAYIAVGGDGFAPGGPAQSRDLIKIDVGCVVSGYSSDGARTVVLGAPQPDAVRIYDALHRAVDTGFAMLRPGTPLAEIYRATSASMWDQGFETYGRGHFGHGVGASIWSEEWPFISASSDAVIESGMVLAFETPWYIDGLGGFIIEDQVLITQTGAEVMAPLSRDLLRIS